MAYATRSDIELIFGARNVALWADADNEEDAGDIEARIDWALARATNDINDRLRRSRYTIPFDPPPQSVIDQCAQKAGVYLYRLPRAMADGEDANQQVDNIETECERWFTMVHAGHINLDAEQTDDAVPRVVNHSADPTTTE